MKITALIVGMITGGVIAWLTIPRLLKRFFPGGRGWWTGSRDSAAPIFSKHDRHDIEKMERRIDRTLKIAIIILTIFACISAGALYAIIKYLSK